MKNKNLIQIISVLSIPSAITSYVITHKPSIQILKHRNTKLLVVPFDKDIDDDSISSELDSKLLNRRKLFSNSHKYGSTLPFLLSTKSKTSAAQSLAQQESKITSSKATPLLDVPMKRLKLPGGALGRDYVIIELLVEDQGPFEFMLDSGLSIEMITPHLQTMLGLSKDDGNFIKGISATGKKSVNEALIELNNVKFANGLSLPTLHAVITDFPQEHIDPLHDPVEGMLGMEMLELFDVDFDFPNKRLRLWEPGTINESNLIQIPAAVLNESGLLGIRVTTPKSNESLQPILGIIDCGASFSTINWKAASLLNLPTDKNAYKNNPKVMGISVDGKPFPLPTTKVQFTFSGNMQFSNDKKTMTFDKPPKNWKPWDEVQVGVGDLPVFDDLLGDGRKSMKDFPIALIGLDVLSQRRLILETGSSKSRSRRIFVSPA